MKIKDRDSQIRIRNLRISNPKKVLKDFIHGFDLIKLAPNASILKVEQICAGGTPLTARVLAEPGKQYAICVHGGAQALLTLDLPQGIYTIEWVHTRTGARVKNYTINHTGGVLKMASPEYSEEIALKILLVK